jgi:DNA adenine methylase
MPKPIIPWIGGKRKLASAIFPLFPDHQCYVEPFCGAAALFFLKQPSPVEVLNDINGELVNLYRVVKHHLEELYKQFKWTLASRSNWEWLQVTPAKTLTDVQRAARFLYLQKLAFGGKVDGQCFGTATTSRPRFNIFTLEEDLQEAHFRLARTTIEHLPWQEAVCRYDRPHTLFYCDPPYWQVEGYGVDFPWEEYEALARMAKEIEGQMIISINDHPDIRELFKGLPVVEIDHKYTVAGGDSATSCVELVYGTWPGGVPRPRVVQQGLFDGTGSNVF